MTSTSRRACLDHRPLAVLVADLTAGADALARDIRDARDHLHRGAR